MVSDFLGPALSQLLKNHQSAVSAGEAGAGSLAALRIRLDNLLMPLNLDNNIPTTDLKQWIKQYKNVIIVNGFIISRIFMNNNHGSGIKRCSKD
jgi:hypothetical protein